MIGCVLLPSPEPNGFKFVADSSRPHPNPLPLGEGVKPPPQRGGPRGGYPPNSGEAGELNSTPLPIDFPRLETLAARLAAFSDRVELRLTPPPARCYLDLSHLTAAEWQPVAVQIGQMVQTELGLAARIGLAPGKFSAELAATTSPEPITVIPPDQAAAFLAAQPLACLPLDEALRQRLARLGLRTLGDLAALPAGAVLTQFGPEGRRWQQLAQGLNERRVARYQAPTKEQLTCPFGGPVAERAVLAAALQQAAEELAARLARRGLATGHLSLTLHLVDERTWVEQRRPAQPLSRAERLHQTLLALLPAQTPGPVTNLTVSLTELHPVRPEQLDLFAPALAETGLLAGLLPQLVARFGPCFYQARLTEPLAYLPEGRFGLQAVSGW